jgi:hypothetical protein
MIFLTLMAAMAADPPRRCMLEGWSNDTDPAGLRVHAGPGLATTEIGRLPQPSSAMTITPPTSTSSTCVMAG